MKISDIPNIVSHNGNDWTNDAFKTMQKNARVRYAYLHAIFAKALNAALGEVSDCEGNTRKCWEAERDRLGHLMAFLDNIQNSVIKAHDDANINKPKCYCKDGFRVNEKAPKTAAEREEEREAAEREAIKALPPELRKYYEEEMAQ